MENTITIDGLPDPATDKELQAVTRRSAVSHYRWRSKGLLPFHRVGGQIMYTRQDVQQFFERCKRDAIAT